VPESDDEAVPQKRRRQQQRAERSRGDGSQGRNPLTSLVLKLVALVAIIATWTVLSWWVLLPLVVAAVLLLMYVVSIWRARRGRADGCNPDEAVVSSDAEGVVMAYDLKDMKAPRAAGPLLRALTVAAEAPVSGGALAQQLLTNVGVGSLRLTPSAEAHPMHPPGLPPVVAAPPGSEGGARVAVPALPAPRQDTPFLETAADFVAAYRDGRLTPVRVAERILEHTKASERSDPPLRLFIAQDPDDLLAQARESAARYEKGEPLGDLDGVPIAVKDELDLRPYPTTVGTRFLGRDPVRDDAEVVARLRRAGALLIGKANMQEIGLGVTGINPHHGTARNPYDPTRCTGGSSSGPAASVAAGLCPIAVAADGGGSIRVPASFCGQVGLKATYGRVSEHGAAPLCWSVAHVGPIAATARDAALAYAVMAGPDPKDLNSLGHPDVGIDGLDDCDLHGVRLGIYRPWFEHADPDVVSCCEGVLSELERAGAEVKDVEIPELDLVRVVHLVTIVSEMAASQLEHHAAHRRDYALDTRLNLALARSIRAHDYVHAQRVRVRLSQHFDRALAGVDAIVTPASAITAPPIAGDALATGESDLVTTGRIMRFAPAANLTGLPAVSFPAGYDSSGMPVGFQAMAGPWREDLLLRLAAVAERSVERRRPRVHFRLLA